MPDNVTAARLNSAATRTTLLTARALTDPVDERIPVQLPTDLDELRTALITLERVAAEYSGRAHDDQTTPDDQTRSYVVVVATRAAVELMETAQARVQVLTEDYRAAHMVAEAALLAVMTWRLCTGTDREQVFKGAMACASFVAGSENLADTTPISAAEKVARAMARDAFTLGVESLAIGDTARARRFLTFASAHGLDDASALAATIEHRDDTDTATRIDFATDPSTWRAVADIANRRAVFHAASGPEPTTTPGHDDERPLPCIEIAGVQVYAYLHGGTGALRVSVDIDDAQTWLIGDDGLVPLGITVQGQEVFAD